jgi:hypothetical protein
MARKLTIDWTAVWVTALLVTIPATVVNRLSIFIEKRINFEIYERMTGYFSLYQPDYFPLLFLLSMFAAIFVLTLIYMMIIPYLPSNVILRGLLVGAFLFLVVDLPYLIHTGYTTMMPGVVARSTALSALLGDLVNGYILAYIQKRVSAWSARQKKSA